MVEQKKDYEVVVGFSVNPEITVDIVFNGQPDVKLEMEDDWHPSGTSYDVALALRMLNKRAYLIGAVGKNDIKRAALEYMLRRSEIDANLLGIRQRTAFSFIAPKQRIRGSNKPPLDNFSSSDIGNAISSLRADYHVVTGLTPGIHDIRLCRMIFGNSGIRVLNPRLTLVQERDSFVDLLNCVDWVFLNQDEARPFVGSQDQDFSAFFKCGVSVVIMTKGAGGSVLATREGERVEMPAYQAGQLVDEVGAGDCYLGYFLAARLEGASWHHAMLRATVAAGIKVTRWGTTNIPNCSEVESVISEGKFYS